jgi:beta-galactosidase/beta-glucuronidase
MPNDEIRMTKEARMTKPERPGHRSGWFSSFVIWTFVILSSFGFRHSAAAPVSAPTDDPPSSVPSDTKPAAGVFLTDIFSHRDNDRPQIDLNGTWEFRRDGAGKGVEEGWHKGKGQFADRIRIPGAPQAQGIGEPNARQKSFFLEPFWVRRTFQLPALDAGKRAWLRIGGILPAAEVYLNGTYVGYTQSSRTQQRVDVTRFVRLAAENLIAVKVCDFPKVRLDGLWEMAECLKNWTGVYRPIAMEITDRLSVIDAYVRPRVSTASVQVSLRLSEAPAQPTAITLRVMDGERPIGQLGLALGDRPSNRS